MAVQMMECNINYIADGQLCTNVTHWSADVVETNLWNLAKRFVAALDAPTAGDAIYEAIRGIMSDDCFISSAFARVLLPSPGTKAIKVYPSGDFPGLVASEIYAQSVASVMKSITASGPDYTGRTFFPAVPESMLVKGRFTDTFRPLFNDVMAAFDAGIVTADGTWDQVIFKRSNNTYEPVTNRQLNPNPGTIRKRLLPV